MISGPSTREGVWTFSESTRRSLGRLAARPTDAVGHEMFARGFETTLGSRAVQNWPMPPAVARALEREFLRIHDGAATLFWTKWWLLV